MKNFFRIGIELFIGYLRQISTLMDSDCMSKKAIIVISLVKECADCSDEEIEREIYSELSKEPYRIPWGKKVEKVTVESARNKKKRGR